ncbi:hypothetical protein G5B31_17315 [Rhodobacter sp. SGA-6-6]|uniref:hypothetical protein n=1 Tax=Rhodobacter sp. SGA-6-6 TaxID=2710882 RepID=UPI0013EBF3D3|nr:hypothetical protein [Rhodobacter sp. SGA-6-6]NGM47299.1 hypothetical protein [Rhodobacter sp. SGA-6-6]
MRDELLPFLAENDPDARFLNAHFSTDPEETGAELDRRTARELQALAADLHPRSLHALAWRYRHGDDVPADHAKFKDLLAAAALLGNKPARQDLAHILERDLGLSGLGKRFPRNEDE